MMDFRFELPTGKELELDRPTEIILTAVCCVAAVKMFNAAVDAVREHKQNKQIKRLKKQVARLEERIEALEAK